MRLFSFSPVRTCDGLTHRTLFLTVVVCFVLLVAATHAGGSGVAAPTTKLVMAAGPVVIDFEDVQTIAPGSSGPAIVNDQYAARGVIFNNLQAFDYSARSNFHWPPDFAHSGTKAVEQCYSTEFCTLPIAMTFSAPQSRVKVWVGYSGNTGTPARTVVLTAVNSAGDSIAASTAALGPSTGPISIRVPLEVNSSRTDIAGARVAFVGASTNALAVDDVEFEVIAPSPTVMVSMAGTGSGTVVSSPAGITCGQTCSATFAAGATVTLTATPAAGSTFTGWSGACAGSGACTVTANTDASVTAAFAATPAPQQTTPQIRDASVPEPPPKVTLTTANPADTNVVAELATGVTGNGVIETLATRAPTTARIDDRIACGFNNFRCYTRLPPDRRILLRARPLRGYVFKQWTGACAGQDSPCSVRARALQSVTALFTPRSAAASVGLEVRPIDVNVGWVKSVGSGRIVVSGRIGDRGTLRVQLRRPGGGTLLARRFAVSPGRFQRVLPLRRNVLPRGALVLPGGFVVSVTGSSRRLALPFQLRPTVIPAPPEGVVRRTFASTARDGPATARLPTRSTVAWAHFRLATQPSSRLPITVAWYWPNGRLVGAVRKSNRPEIVSSLGLATGIPNGSWVAELRAGSKIVRRLKVRIG